MAARIVSVTVDASDPPGLARFWAAALRWEVGPDEGGAVELVPTDDTPFPIVFRPTSAPKIGQNRIHFDLTTTSLEEQQESVESLLALGARHEDVGQRPDEPHVVLADPEGNELCLIDPGNSFLAGCGRLGALSCDGSRAVGLFWREVLGWPLIWDEGEETAIRPPEASGPIISWGGGPDIPKHGTNRIRLDLAGAEVDRLLGLGATSLDDGPFLADPDGNEFSVR